MRDERGGYEPAVRDYLVLGLRLGKLIDGFVDSWYGDPALARQVDAEPAASPAELAADAAGQLAALAGSGLSETRRRFLAAQIGALECAAGRLAGRPTPFLAEVRASFEVEIGLGDPGEYAEVHEEISGLLPGPGGRRAAVEAFYARNRIPPDRLLGAVRAVSAELRAITRPLFGLPEGESVEYEIVTGKPWNAFNRYLGGFRSVIALNAEAGGTIAALPLLATHEAYPGHHTEHCLKEAGPATALGHGEHHISLVNTPRCLMSEGTAELAAAVVPGPGWGRWTAEVLAGQGVHTDGELVEQLLGLIRRLMPARQDAAIMLHDRGADPGDVAAYLQRWLLLPRERADQLVRFLVDPLWRAYSVTYVEGARLVGAWLDARPEGVSPAERYRTLLVEPLLPSMLQADLGGVAA